MKKKIITFIVFLIYTACNNENIAETKIENKNNKDNKKTVTVINKNQTNFSPSIMIITPQKVDFKDDFKNEILELYEKVKNDFEKYEKSDLSSLVLTENYKAMIKNDMEDKNFLSFDNLISFKTKQFLSVFLFNILPNVYINLQNIKVKSSKEDIKNTAIDYNYDYILYFDELVFFKKDNITYLKTKVKFYDKLNDTIIFDKEIIKDWSNKGNVFSCVEKSIDCTINNSTSEIIGDLINYFIKKIKI